MKKFAACIAVLMIAGSAGAKESPLDLTSWLDAMLHRVAVATEQHLQKEGDVPVAVAGLRGSEQKAGQLEPFWKGDMTVRSLDYQAYREIERRMQEGKYADALRLSDEFKKRYAKSRLLPEVQFTTGLAYAGMGNHKQAVASFEELIKLYPQHELVDASKEGIARLKKA